MFKFILPTILIGVAIAGFFLFARPLYREITEKKVQVASYNEALDNSKALESLRDNLTQKYNSFSEEDLSRIQKFLPDSVDNIRLILEIEKIAAPYGMILKDVQYEAASKEGDPAYQGADFGQGGRISSNRDYRAWDLEFSTQGTYRNFVSFIKDLENNLRIVDISSIQFYSNANSGMKTGMNPSLPEAYRYNFKIKTYWLKD